MKAKMYILSAAVALSGLLTACKESGNKVDTNAISTDVVENPTEITFEKDVHDFGEIIQGEVVKTEFKFTNTGKHDLIITGARGSCGCTVPEWPKEPIHAGQSDVIKVQFNSANKNGPFNKTVTVTANTVPSETKVVIKGTVIVPQKSDKE